MRLLEKREGRGCGKCYCSEDGRRLVTIVITGGAGFIGRQVAHQSLNTFGGVTVIDKAPKPLEFSSARGLTYLQANASRIANLLRNRKLSGRPRIIHLAAETSVPKSVLRPLSSVRSNVEMTCAVLEFARKTDSKSFVFASSAAVYGERKTACRETDSLDPRSPYAASKLAGEVYCRMYAMTYGIPVTILRYFNVYGPGQSDQGSGIVASFLKSVSQGKPPIIYGDGWNARDFIFIDDVVDATLKSLSAKLSPGIVMNIGTGRSITVSALAAKVLKLGSAPDLKPIYLPARQGDVRFSKANMALAREKIGLKPMIDIDKGLKLTYLSMRHRLV